MAGLEKIKSQILDEAKESANVKIEDAKAQAEQMKTQAQAEGSQTGRTDPEEVGSGSCRTERACEVGHRSSEKNETSGSKAGDDRRDHREGV